MSAFDQLRNELRSVQPVPPVWRMQCRCRFRPGSPGEIAVCKCGYWWRAGQRGRWRAICARRAFRVLVPGLMREVSCFELTGGWPDG
jgi:hypothetical protein